MRWQLLDRADLENSATISVPMLNQYISQSQKRLFNMLVAAYGNDYFVAPLFQFNTSSGQYYPLPDGKLITVGGSTPAPACFKLLGVDLQYPASPTGFVTLRRFEEIERNRAMWPNTAVNFLGNTNLRYRLSGTNIEFIPIPMSAQLIQLKYIQKPSSLQFLPTCATTAGSAVITMADVGDLSVGMSCYGPGIPSTTVPTILSINTGANTVTISANVLAGYPIVTLAFWTDAVTIDGIAGWEEFIILDGAIKARIKQEEPVEELVQERASMIAEIEGLAEGRDVGQACHVSDVLSINGMGDGGDGWENL